MSAVLEVLEPGLATSVQDAGRIGLRRFGVPTSGALDPVAFRLANALAGAPEGAAALELRLLGPTLKALDGPARLALVGAAARIEITRAAGGEIERIAVGPELWRTLTLAPGDVVKIGALGGATATLAAAGGVDVAPVLGSCATSLKGGFGGLEGRLLRAGDQLRLGPAEGDLAATRALAFDLSPPPGGLVRLRVVLGPQAERFTEAAIATFLAAEWRVTAAADRMGLRLDGPALTHARGHDIVSDGIAAGAIQVPGDGKPILLLADRQTTGGYPKIAAVITADLAAAGRLGPGMRVAFEAIGARAGAEAARAQARALAQAVAAIGAWREPGAIDLEKLYGENLVTAAAPDEEV